MVAKPDNTLLSNELEVTHGLETSDRGLLEGQSHEGRKERDHSGGAAPRSLTFDTLSICECQDFVPPSRATAPQVEEEWIPDESRAQARAEKVPE